MLIFAGLFAAVVAFVTNWLALIPWRRARNQHWTERARLYYPVRVAAASNLWVQPAVLTMFCFLLWPDESPHWALLVLVTAIGAVAGTVPMDREVFPRIGLSDLLRQIGVTCLIRFLMWFVFLATTALMPPEFNVQALVLSVILLAACILWNRNGWVYLGRKLGWILPAPERLQNIVVETATLMKVPFKELWLIRISLAQAFAMPGSRVLLFTERLLELLSNQQIATVCAHELGHLTEARHQYFRRYIVWLIFLPWILFKPMVHTLGAMGFFLLLINTMLISFLYRRISRSLEARADTVAKANEPDPGTYAQALCRLHEDSLVPAVLATERATHPHLYDRLLTAGVTPEFPRPVPAASLAWPGHLFSAALGLLAVLLIMRLTQQH